MSNYDWGYKEAKKMMAEGGKVQVKGYARGGAVKKHSEASEKKMDMAQDKKMMERHNRLMHPGQKSKLAKGGMAKKKGC